MDDSEAMKGPRKKLICLNYGVESIQLVSYCDGSLGIIRNGATMGVWNRQEEPACLATLVQLVGKIDSKTLLVIRLRSPEELSSPALLN